MKDEQKYYSKKSNDLGWGEDVARLDKERLELISRFIKGEEVLDVGCGLGFYVEYLNSQGFKAEGVDLVKEFVKKAKQANRGEFREGRADKLPFEENSFDTILLFDILEHGDDEKILKEAKRVSRGRILVIVPKVVDKQLGDSGVIFRHYIDKSHLREYQEEDLRELGKKVGLKIENIQKVHPIFNETVFWALFGGSKLLKKILRKIVLILLPQNKFYTEIFVVYEK